MFLLASIGEMGEYKMFRFTNLVIFEITRDCNFHCSYCLQTDKEKFAGEMIDFELFKNIIDKMVQERILNLINKDKELDFSLVFHGGEFLLSIKNGNFVKYLDYAYNRFKEYNLKMVLGTQTNGTLITDDAIKIIDKYGVSLGLSIDGFNGANDLRWNNSEKSDNYYKNLISKLATHNITYGIISVVTKQNIDTTEEFEDFIINNFNAGYTYLPVDDPHGNSDNEIYDQIFEKVYKRQIDRFICGGAIDTKFKTKIQMTFYDILTSHETIYKGGCGGKICGTGISMISVRPDGKCGYCDRITFDMKENFVKNATDYDFLGIHQFKSALKVAYYKHDCIIEKHCDFCRALYICDYGCLAFTYSTLNKLTIEKRKVCDINLKIYDYINDNIILFVTKLAENNINIEFSDKFYEFKHEVIDKLFNNNIVVRRDGSANIIKFTIRKD